jgi:hypothetical protein
MVSSVGTRSFLVRMRTGGWVGLGCAVEERGLVVIRGHEGDEVVNLVVVPARVREDGEGAVWSRDVRMITIL